MLKLANFFRKHTKLPFFLVTSIRVLNNIPSKLNQFQPSYIETSHLIYNANYMTGFYMKYNTGLKWVERILKCCKSMNFYYRNNDLLRDNFVKTVAFIIFFIYFYFRRLQIYSSGPGTSLIQT